MADKKLHDDALDYHALPTPGKISINISKGLYILAYSNTKYVLMFYDLRVE